VTKTSSELPMEDREGGGAVPGDAVERRQRVRPSWVILGVCAVLIALAAYIPSPYVIESPGPVVNALGSVETDAGELHVVSISGTETYPSDSGALNILSVSVTGTPEDRVPWLALLPSLVNPHETLTPMSTMFPAQMTGEQNDELNTSMMNQSQLDATAAALRSLGEDVGSTLTVGGVSEDGPSAGVLEDGDVIQGVAGAPVFDVFELRTAVADASASGPVELDIIRDDREETVRVDASVPAGAPDRAEPMLGIAVVTDFDFPFDVSIELDRIGGPSAGLMFALAITDVLTPGSLTGGASVAGTGTIDASGNVGPIGGLPQKIWGAADAGSTLMLIPRANCADVPEQLPDELTIVPVSTLDEAIELVEHSAAGETVPGLERCAR